MSDSLAYGRLHPQLQPDLLLVDCEFFLLIYQLCVLVQIQQSPLKNCNCRAPESPFTLIALVYLTFSFKRTSTEFGCTQYILVECLITLCKCLYTGT